MECLGAITLRAAILLKSVAKMLPAKLAIIDTLAATVTAPDVIVQANNLPATQSAPLIASRVLICTRSGAIHYKWLFYINDMCEMLC
jgi:hypothetical protein